MALALAAPGAAQARQRQCIEYLTVTVPDRIVSDVAMVHVFDRDGRHLASGCLYPDGATAALASANGARVMLLGGAHLPGERFIEWNFVSSARAKIDAARAA